MTDFSNNCRLDLEDREMLSALPALPQQWSEFGRPDSVDIDFHRSENQGRLGSCQGQGLTSCLERLQFVKSRGDASMVEQLSRIFAYLATQKIDGISGDRGSTISGGIKLALQHGVPPESLTGYPSSYPGSSDRSRILSPANYAAGEPYKPLSSWRVEDDVELTKNFIGGGGGISFGISWYSSLIPRDRIVRKFEPSRNRILGGHAMAVLGYQSDAEGGGLRAVNSHADGPYIITPDAWRQMVRHRNTAAIGIVGEDEPVPVDWDTNSPYV